MGPTFAIEEEREVVGDQAGLPLEHPGAQRVGFDQRAERFRVMELVFLADVQGGPAQYPCAAPRNSDAHNVPIVKAIRPSKTCQARGLANRGESQRAP